MAALLDKEVARDLADRARDVAGCRGLLVPSAAFLDDRSRGNAVLFFDRERSAVGELVTRCRVAGEVRIGG